jgi:hypothetical protein
LAAIDVNASRTAAISGRNVSIRYSLDYQNCQWQHIDALLKLQITIDRKEAVEVRSCVLKQLAILDA